MLKKLTSNYSSEGFNDYKCENFGTGDKRHVAVKGPGFQNQPSHTLSILSLSMSLLLETWPLPCPKGVGVGESII